ncbi:MAG TPA: FhaA domain-containing protein [Actinospica sp.]|nr:FhaA domain-containing protein [Actinospica sp.]
MGVLQRFERRLEGLVNGAFAKAFKSEVQPVEIASALQRECDDRAAPVSQGRVMVPNDFTVELGAHDYERLATYAGPLSAELAELLQEHGREQRYMFVGPVEVKFERVQDLTTGMFRIRSQALAGVVQMPGYPPQAPGYGAPQQPPGYPPLGGEMPPSVPPQQPGFGAPQPQPGFGAPAGMGAGYPPQPQAGPGTCWIEVNGVRHPLSRAVTSLGRGTDVDLRIDDPSVSRRHAEIRVGVPSVISDLGSTNGIVVDDQHVRQAQLRDGSVIHLGNTTIIFRQDAR